MKSRCSYTTRETEATYHALFTNIQDDRFTLLAVLHHPTSFPHISFTLAFHSAIPIPHLSLPPHTSSFTCPSTRHPPPFISSTLAFHSVIPTLPLSRTPTHLIIHATPPPPLDIPPLHLCHATLPLRHSHTAFYTPSSIPFFHPLPASPHYSPNKKVRSVFRQTGPVFNR